MPGLGRNNQGFDIICIHIFLFIRTVEKKIELVFGMVQDKVPEHFPHEITIAFQFMPDKDTGIYSNDHGAKTKDSERQLQKDQWAIKTKFFF
jgi:hypothetical protein